MAERTVRPKGRNGTHVGVAEEVKKAPANPAPKPASAEVSPDVIKPLDPKYRPQVRVTHPVLAPKKDVQGAKILDRLTKFQSKYENNESFQATLDSHTVWLRSSFSDSEPGISDLGKTIMDALHYLYPQEVPAGLTHETVTAASIKLFKLMTDREPENGDRILLGPKVIQKLLDLVSANFEKNIK